MQLNKKDCDNQKKKIKKIYVNKIKSPKKKNYKKINKSAGQRANSNAGDTFFFFFFQRHKKRKKKKLIKCCWFYFYCGQ